MADIAGFIVPAFAVIGVGMLLAIATQDVRDRLVRRRSRRDR